MKQSAKALVALLILMQLALIGAAQNASDSALKQYQRIQSESQNQRFFRYDDGAPKFGYRFSKPLRDESGYPWFETENPNTYYRFNGTTFQNMTSSFPPEERDSLLSMLKTDGDIIHLSSKHYLYRWEGHKFSKFAFPKDDAINHTQAQENKILCVGTKGYAVLDGNNWKYIRINLNSTKDNKDELRFSYKASGRLETATYDQVYYSLDSSDLLYRLKHRNQYSFGESSMDLIPMIWNRDLVLDCFSSNGYVSIPILNTDQLMAFYHKNQVIIPELRQLSNGSIYIYIKDTNLLFWIDPKLKKAVIKNYPIDTRIHAIERVNEREDWIFYSVNGELVASELGSQLESQPNIFRMVLSTPYLQKEYLIRFGNYIFRIGAINGEVSETIYRIDKGFGKFYPVDSPDLKTTYASGTMLLTGKYLAYSVRNKNLSQVHDLYVTDFYDRIRKYQIVDPAENLRVVDFNELSEVLMLAGKEHIIALSLKKACESIWLWDTNERANVDYSSSKLIVRKTENAFKIYQHLRNTITEFVSFKDAISYGTDQTNGITYLKVDDGSPNQSIIALDVKTGDTKTLAKGDSWRYFTYFLSSYLILNNDFSYKLNKKGIIKEGSLQALKTKLENMLTSTSVRSEMVLQNYLSIHLISDKLIFVKSAKLRITQGGKLTESASSTNREKPPASFELINGEEPEIIIPPFTYNLDTSEIIIQPTWLADYNLEDQSGKSTTSYILHYETVGKANNLRISKLIDGKLNKQPEDFVYPFTSELIPYFKSYQWQSEQFPYVDDRIFYHHNGLWQSLPEKLNVVYGAIKSIFPLGDDLWICQNNALIRYSKSSKQSFVFTGKHGLPNDLRDVYIGIGNQMFILALSGIYAFNPDEGNAVLNLPWLQANNIRYGSNKLTRLKHNQNNITIPVDILNTLYPERIRLTYRLLGCEKDWKQREYTSQIEYPKLPPGRYEFQINATSPTGRQAKTLSMFFIIKPPLYSTWWAFILYTVLLFFLGRYLYRLRIRQLETRNQALENTIAERTQELRDRQQHIQESIDYASLIQKSILPQEAELAEAFKGHFVIWKPLATVGGDFYWMHTTESGVIYFAVVDCTGHGVPGALLSMTVNSLLNHLIKDKALSEPALILQSMHREIGATMHQDREHTQQDGIEIALLKIEGNSLIFCGAGLHLLFYNQETSTLQQIRGDKRGLGGLKWHSELNFTEHKFTYKPSLRLYLYTDGIIDQPVPRHDRVMRLGHPDWLDLVSGWAEYPLEEQLDLFNERIATMLEYHEQRDDITIIGLKIV